MVATEILAQGVEQGIITAEQAQRLRALENVGEPPELPASPDDEQLRFIGGFSDVFVTLGLAMFLGAIGFFAQAAGRLVASIVIAAAAWLLAEFFTRIRRMALPSIVLLIVFACAVFLAACYSQTQSRLGQPHRRWPANCGGGCCVRYRAAGRAALLAIPGADYRCCRLRRADGDRPGLVQRTGAESARRLSRRHLHVRSCRFRARNAVRHGRPGAADQANRHRFLAAPAGCTADRSLCDPRTCDESLGT